MLAQGGAGVFLAEQATALEFGHDELDELLIGARDVGGGDDEAVARTLDEPLLHLVGDLLRAADEGDLGAAAAGDLHEVAHGRSEEHTSGLQSLMRISYAVFCLKKKTKI